MISIATDDILLTTSVIILFKEKVASGKIGSVMILVCVKVLSFAALAMTAL